MSAHWLVHAAGNDGVDVVVMGVADDVVTVTPPGNSDVQIDITDDQILAAVTLTVA